MRQSLCEKLNRLVDRIDELDRELGSEEAASDVNRLRDLFQERSEIEPIVLLYRELRQTQADIDTARELLADPEMHELGQAELASSKTRAEALEYALQRTLLPRDPNDGRDLFLEVRAGTGGD